MLWKLWKKRRPLRGSVCWVFTDSHLLQDPAEAGRIAAAITEQQMGAMCQLIGRGKRNPIMLQFHVERIDRREQLIRETKTPIDGLRGLSK